MKIHTNKWTRIDKLLTDAIRCIYGDNDTKAAILPMEARNQALNYCSGESSTVNAFMRDMKRRDW